MIRLQEDGRALQITCGGCNSTNRVPLGRLGQRPLCGRCRQVLEVDRPLAVTDATFDEVVTSSDLPLLADFWAPWCGPCRAVAPELERLAREQRGKLLVIKVNTDENPQAASRYDIRAIPSLLVFRGGLQVARHAGVLPASGIMQLLRQHMTDRS